MAKLQNPIQNLFIDIEKIMDFIVIKDSNKAKEYETTTSAKNAARWINALMQQDSYLSYKDLYTPEMFQEVTPNIKRSYIDRWMQNVYDIPLQYREHLQNRCRNIVINSYIEENNYYRMLHGLPNVEDTEEDYLYLSEPTRLLYDVAEGVPIHELPETIQNKFLLTDEYQYMLSSNPDKKYLLYIGMYKIDIIVARAAKDFQLIRYIPLDRSDVNPNLIKDFSQVYNNYRDYVVYNLYNKSFEDIIENYRGFMELIMIFFTMMQLCNKSVEHTSDYRFLDDSVIQIIFQMYDIPRSLIMTKDVRRNLATALLKLIRKKATNEVFYDLVKILDYDNIIISKLMLMKEQVFDENGQAMFTDGEPIKNADDMDLLSTIDPDTGKPYKQLLTDIFFQAVDLKDTNPYDSIITYKAKKYDYDEITSGDPRWWELDDVIDLVRNKHYTNADSKYIMVESIVEQMSYLFEYTYFMRMILDNKRYTDLFMIKVPELFGSTPISLFDLIVYLLAAVCEKNGLTGDIITSASGLLAVAGFNFDIDITLFTEFLETTNYVDKDKILNFISNLSMKDPSDINRLFYDVMIPMRDWLEYEISQANDKDTFIEYEKIYRALYTYDAVRAIFVDDFQSPSEVIKDKYNLSDEDWTQFKLFYPHTISGKTIHEGDDSEYFPFLGESVGEQKTWFIPTIRGNLYFYDILNSPDLRYIITDGVQSPNHIFWNNGELDQEMISNIISSIKNLNDSELNNAYFKVRTYVPNTPYVYEAGEMLPITIRNEIFKTLLIEKIEMDMRGEAVAPSTYKEYISRKNPMLYELFGKFEISQDEWLGDLMTIVLAIESELDMKLKYFEQAVVGTEFFFKPLITLIKYFKSYMIDFARSGLRYIFDDKMDAGGNSNMLKLFDRMHQIMFHITIGLRGEDAEFRLYDTEHFMKHNIILSDKSEMIKCIYNKESNSYDKVITPRKSYMGSIHLIDECRIFKNGKELDPIIYEPWYIGESDIGRYVDNSDHIDQVYKGVKRAINARIDTEGWKEFVESYNPD